MFLKTPLNSFVCNFFSGGFVYLIVMEPVSCIFFVSKYSRCYLLDASLNSFVCFHYVLASKFFWSNLRLYKFLWNLVVTFISQLSSRIRSTHSIYSNIFGILSRMQISLRHPFYNINNYISVSIVHVPTFVIINNWKSITIFRVQLYGSEFSQTNKSRKFTSFLQ